MAKKKKKASVKKKAEPNKKSGKTTSKAKPVATVAAKVIAKKPKAMKPAKAEKQAPKSPIAASPSKLIDQRIADLGDWRGNTLAQMRALIHQAEPAVIEEWKWRGVPVWSHHGIICTGETYKQVVKLTFAHGAKLPDPSNLFNSSLEGNTRRAIDIHEGEQIDAAAFKALVQAAVVRNTPAAKNAKLGVSKVVPTDVALPPTASAKKPSASKKKPSASKKETGLSAAAASDAAPATSKKSKAV